MYQKCYQESYRLFCNFLLEDMYNAFKESDATEEAKCAAACVVKESGGVSAKFSQNFERK